MPQVARSDTALGQLGSIEVSRYETATGPRLRLRRGEPHPADAFLDPLELEGLTRVRHKPIPLLPERDARGDRAPRPGETLAPLQNEFALVSVAVIHTDGEPGLLITDMNAGLTVVLAANELNALLAARHRDFAPLIDTSDLIAIPEPDIDQV